ncbi:hypothetical protein N2152v2_002258 [Parachlorella kessleri]
MATLQARGGARDGQFDVAGSKDRSASTWQPTPARVAKGTKKGLGQSQAVGKMGGVNWAGSKVTFQDDENNDSEGRGREDRKRCPELVAVGSSTHLDALAAAEVAPLAPGMAAGAHGRPEQGQGGEEQPSGLGATSTAAAATAAVGNGATE